MLHAGAGGSVARGRRCGVLRPRHLQDRRRGSLHAVRCRQIQPRVRRHRLHGLRGRSVRGCPVCGVQRLPNGPVPLLDRRNVPPMLRRQVQRVGGADELLPLPLRQVPGPDGLSHLLLLQRGVVDGQSARADGLRAHAAPLARSYRCSHAGAWSVAGCVDGRADTAPVAAELPASERLLPRQEKRDVRPGPKPLRC